MKLNLTQNVFNRLHVQLLGHEDYKDLQRFKHNYTEQVDTRKHFDVFEIGFRDKTTDKHFVYFYEVDTTKSGPKAFVFPIVESVTEVE